MSREAQRFCRKIDVVTVKGSAVAMPIYTYDTHQNQEFPQLTTPKFACLDINDVLKKQAEAYDSSVWESDGDLIQLRKLVTPEFMMAFKTGIDHYLNGRWQTAREKLEEADKLILASDSGGDGPSRTILKYMEAKNFECPSDWQGYRPLTSK